MSTPRVFYDRDDIKIIHGDCRDVLSTISPGSVGLVLTDPPYGMNNDCDHTRFTVGPNGDGPGRRTNQKHNPVIGDNEPFDPTPLLTFPNVVLFGCNHFAERLPVGSILVWLKRYDGGFGSFLSDAELAWVKGGCGVYCHRDLSLQGEDRLHPTQKPVGLMQWILGKYSKPGDLILDPYMGSGPVAVACQKMGRRYIGIEIDISYCTAAYKRLQQTAMRLDIPA